MNSKTWENIIEPPEPIRVSNLKVHVVDGESFSLATKRPDLYTTVLDYWSKKQGDMAVKRAHDLAEAVRLAKSGDDARLRRMQNQIGGVEIKHRLNMASLISERLALVRSGTNYMEFIGTNERAIDDSEWREKLMEAGFNDRGDVNAYFANPLAECTVLYGAEAGQINDRSKVYVVVGWRSDKVMIYPNVPHVFGGVLNDLVIGGGKELKEEIGLEDHELGVPIFYGIIRQGKSRHPEVILGSSVMIGQDELLDRWGKSSARFEHRNIQCLKLNEIPSLLEEYGDRMVPSGAAALTALVNNYNPRRKKSHLSLAL
ncbi:MAG TPA: hypothetical protein VJI98_06050 [Candidatus Nanoarchaeia archaeon]|nr:hypothetical protein [Candidatus Nanoarchaeia archaeon]